MPCDVPIAAQMAARRPVVLRPDRADQRLRALAAVQVAVVDPLRQGPQLRHGLGDHRRDGLQGQLEGEAGGVLGHRPAEGDQLVGVDEGEGAGERVDAAAAGPEARQVDGRDLFGPHRGAEIEVAQGPVSGGLALEGRRASGVDRRAAPEIGHFREHVRPGGADRYRHGHDQRGRQRGADSALLHINSHGRAPGR